MNEKDLINLIENECVKIGGSWILYEKGIIQYEDVHDIDIYIRTDKGDVNKYGNIKRIFELGFRCSDYDIGNYIEYMHRTDIKRFHIQFIYCSTENEWNQISTVKYIYSKKKYRLNYCTYYNDNAQMERDILHISAIEASKRRG